MTNAVALQANAHKFLNEKYSGKNNTSFAEHITSTLSASAIPLDYSQERDRREAFNAYLNIVDFKTILVDSINTLLIEKWSNTNETWRIWVNNYGLPDFKEMSVTAVGVVPQPLHIMPGTSYGLTELYGEETNAKLSTYGNRILLERRTIVNDDVSAIQSFSSGISAAYDRQIGDKVYNFLKLNPVTFNDTELFHADHSNIVTATSDFEADLSSAVELMCGQKMEFDNGVSEVLRVQPKYLIVPPSKAFTAARIVGEYNAAVTDSQKLTVVVESRLTGFGGWFLACDNPYASIALFTLNDLMVPQIFTHNRFTSDGIEIKHRFDYDVKPIDYRGLVRVM